MPDFPKAGETVPLKVTREARHRVYAGLRWDPREAETLYEKMKTTGVDIRGAFSKKGKFLYKVPLYALLRDSGAAEASEKNLTYDLDLTCFAFDAEGNTLDTIGPGLNDMVGLDHKVYHSGDDFDGGGSETEGYDDERIYVELRGIPEGLHQIIFIITSKNDFSLGEVANPECRLVDSKTENELLNCKLDKERAENKHAYVFARIINSEQGWQLNNIDKFLDCKTGDEIIGALGEYL